MRVVLWLSGCSHHCYNCQNPQTWDANSGVPFDESAKEELFRELDKDYISGLTITGGDPLHEANLDEVLKLVTEIKERYKIPQDVVQSKSNNYNILTKKDNKIRLLLPEKTIWLYSGYTFEELINPTIRSNKSKVRKIILSGIDVLVDGRYVDSQRDISLKWRGSTNQRVINVQESLKQNKIILHCE